ncbi:MAG: 50S ribosomal protein L13 [Parcubacteria group bacterium]|nr:50S ribosomal protein L13 [Parcubacteria group bacterium]
MLRQLTRITTHLRLPVQKRITHEVDARGVPFGRLASRIAGLLSGKSKATYSFHLDQGDVVRVIHVHDVALTGRKWHTWLLYRHSGHPSGLKTIHFAQAFQKNPAAVLREAVRHNLPKHKLAHRMLKRLIVVSD